MSNRKSVVWGLAQATAVLLSLGSHPAMAQPEEVLLMPSDYYAGLGGAFGSSVAIGDGYIAIGAPEDNEQALWSGAVYVFKREATGWVEEAKLLPSQNPGIARLGSSVAISGDLILAGAVHDYYLTSGYGEAFVYRREGTVWIEEARLIPGLRVRGDYFGNSVSIDGNLAVVGAPGGNYYERADFASVFRRYDGSYPCVDFLDCESVGLTTCSANTCEGVAWVEETRLVAPDGLVDTSFGASVAVSGNRIFVGAPGVFHTDPQRGGSVYVFRCEGTTWLEEAVLTAPDPDHFGFGYGVATDGERLVVGTPFGSPVANQSGASYVFRRDGGEWISEGRLSAAQAATYDWVGTFASIVGDLVALGSGNLSGTYLFRRAGRSWVQVGGQFFGRTVAVNCQHLVTGFGRGIEVHVFTISEDCNDNGNPDGCELSGDFDGDADVDLADFEQLHGCITGPGASILPTGCCFFDAELDDDVDLRDFRLFQLAFSGP